MRGVREAMEAVGSLRESRIILDNNFPLEQNSGSNFVDLCYRTIIKGLFVGTLLSDDTTGLFVGSLVVVVVVVVGVLYCYSTSTSNIACRIVN